MFQVFLFLLCVLNGSLQVAGIPTSSAVVSQLEPRAIKSYGAMLATGGAFIVCGMYWPWHDMTGLYLKRLGYMAVGIATLIYGGAVYLTAPSISSFIIMSFTVTFSGLCFVAMAQVIQRMRTLRTLKEQMDAS